MYFAVADWEDSPPKRVLDGKPHTWGHLVCSSFFPRTYSALGSKAVMIMSPRWTHLFTVQTEDSPIVREETLIKHLLKIKRRTKLCLEKNKFNFPNWLGG